MGLFPLLKFIVLDFVLKKGYNSSMAEKVLIVDFMYLWNRIYSIKGTNTGSHIFTLLKHVDESDYYSHKYVVLDGAHSTKYRRTILKSYKANRSDKSETYSDMDKFLKLNAIKLSSINFIKNDNYEADDIITILVCRLNGFDKYIYSGDTDLYQLLRFPRTYIGTKYTRGMIIDPVSKGTAEACYAKRYHLNVKDPSYIVKCKTFKGDTSDNIPIACPGLKTKVIDALIEKFWSNDEPLTSTILLNMAKYLRDYGKQSDFRNFYYNRSAIIRNYKLTQLGYTNTNALDTSLTLQEDGQWA